MTMRVHILRSLPALVTACFFAGFANAQTPVPLDAPGSAPVQALDLADPFFKLVISATPQPKTVAGVESALQPDSRQRQRFVVHEGIKNAAPGLRRSVISFLGQTQSPSGETVVVGSNASAPNPFSNVMMSVFFSPGRFPQSEDGTEVLGWDDEQGRYNYYKLRGSTWMFEGTSSGPEVENRTGCMTCHHNGTPIMKELLVPWANWTSVSDDLDYLRRPPWNPAAAPIFSVGQPVGAQILELHILNALRRFHRRELARARTDLGGGVTRIDDAPNLLRPIFEVTEINIGSTSVLTGNLHPFTTSSLGILRDVEIPSTHFLNSRVLAKSNMPGTSEKGTLNIAGALMFPSVAKVPAAEYDRLVRDNNLQLAACTGPVSGLAGDANFAWLHPEPGLFDVTRIELLLTDDVIDKNFLAAAMAVDFRNPLSAAREQLLQFIPDSFEVSAGGSSDLTEQVLAAINAAPTPLSDEAVLFRDRLRSGTARDLLEQDVETYLAEVTTAFQTPGSTAFQQALNREFATLLARREFVLADPSLCSLAEGPLFPISGN